MKDICTQKKVDRNGFKTSVKALTVLVPLFVLFSSFANTIPIPVDANDDNLSIISGHPGVINVLNNDIGDSNPNSIRIVVNPQNGSVMSLMNVYCNYDFLSKQK